MKKIFFLTVEDLLYIHNQEIRSAGGDAGIRNLKDVKACTELPKVSFEGEYLNDLFEMAASYIVCLSIRHAFIDGNKRTALASALTFLYLNGYKVNEKNDLELANVVLDFLSNKRSKDDIALHLKQHALKIT